jgi:tetratricopeptide (TPR) repeat protein
MNIIHLNWRALSFFLFIFISGCVATTKSITIEEAEEIRAQINVIEKPAVRDTHSFLKALLLNENSSRTCVNIRFSDGNAFADGVISASDAEFILGDPMRAINGYHKILNNLESSGFFNRSRNSKGRVVKFYGKIASKNAYLGQVDDAREALQVGYSHVASTYNHTGHATLFEAEGAIAEANGNLIEAEALYRKSIQNYVFQADKDISSVSLIRILMKTGNLGEAENLTQQIIKHGRGGSYHVLVLGLHIYMHLLYQSARYSEAIETAKVSEYAYKLACGQSGNIYINDIRRLHSASLVALGEWDQALSVIDQIDDSMASNPVDFERLFRGDPSRVIALIKSGDVVSARKEAELAMEREPTHSDIVNYKYMQARAVLAMVELAEGDQVNALKGLDAFMAPFFGKDANDTKTSPALLQVLGESYLELLDGIRGSPTEDLLPNGDAIGTAFIVADYLRSRAVQEAIARAAARAQFSDPQLDTLASKIHETRTSIEGIRALVSHDLTNPHSVRDQKSISQFLASEAALNRHLAELENQMQTRFPKYAELIRPTTPSMPDATALLHSRETLLSYYVGTSATYVWVLTGSGEKRFHKVPRTRSELERLVSNVRHSVELTSSTLGGVQPFDIESAYELYRLLLWPFEEVLSESNEIIVVANRPLSTLPFSVLPKRDVNTTPQRPFFSEYKDVPWVARDHGITYLPSVSSLKALRGITWCTRFQW